MFREIARYVRECPNCMAHKVAQNKPAGLLHPTVINRPWQQVNIDLVGPLPKTNQGHIWMLTMQDRMTKWLEIRAIRRATTPIILQQINEAIILRHGCPGRNLKRTQLKSPKLTSALRALDIRHKFTSVYSPQCNPVERTNRIIKTMLSQYRINTDRGMNTYPRSSLRLTPPGTRQPIIHRPT